MSDNKTMIRFYSVFLLLSALLTYAVDLNAQYSFVVVNSPLISHSFCFAILSGVLTGVIVALAAEVRQYMLRKRQARNALYTIASGLYALISIQKAHIKYYINNQSIPIPENIGDDSAQQPILARISQLWAVDYSTFSKKDDIGLAQKSFMNKLNQIEQSIRNLKNLQIAHNRVQIGFIEKRELTKKVTSASPLMLNTLREEYNELKGCLSEIVTFCLSFEKLDGVRFNWKQGKKTVDDISKKIEANAYYRPGQD